MKRPPSSDSLGALMPVCPSSTDEQGNNPLYAAMMDGYDDDQESCPLSGPEKKRRLSADQVRALEKNFDVENKLDPDRKAKLAQDLALQPRQVAVWFQNRRARWKTKQLEKDYAELKSDYDSLTLDFENLRRDNKALIEEIHQLKSKAKVENCEGEKRDERVTPEIKNSALVKGPSSSDSCDSSAILSDGVPTGNNDFRFQDYQPQQLVKIEEHNFFGEESCSTLFEEDQAPSLHWYESEWS